MTPGFLTFLAAAPEDRRDVFLGTARRLGTAEQNVEKDFWVCWTLDVLFNDAPADEPRLLFKGGTSLSKGFGLIARFSEDIDVTVFREDLGQEASVGELETLSGKKRRTRLDAIKTACQAHVNGPLRDRVASRLDEAVAAAGMPVGSARIEPDPDDQDGQTLLVWYPSVTEAAIGYIRPAVKIESGAKSALDPNRPVIIKPYIAGELPTIDLAVPNVTTVVPERTFWDKAIILHGLRRWFERRGSLRGGGQRVSRHYYDVHRLLASNVDAIRVTDHALALNCVQHARMFFSSPDLDLATAEPGTFALSPTSAMARDLAKDYTAMAGMIFGEAPPFETILDSIARFEAAVNAADTSA